MLRYRSREVLTGLLIYGTGDTLAALLVGEASWIRALGMSLTGALLYGLEIPNYFRWVARRTHARSGLPGAALRTGLAMLYFNPLWVARHLALIHLFSGDPEALAWPLLAVAAQSFLAAIPVTVSANFLIQNLVPLRLRFAASATFSCAMAMYYPLVARWLGD